MQSPLNGIGRYVRELALELQQLQVPLHFYTGGHWSTQLPPSASPSAATASRRWAARLPGAMWWVRQLRNRRFTQGAQPLKASLYHEPSYLAYAFDGPTVITAHDASWVRYPEAHPAARVRLMTRHFPPSLERAARVIVDSDFVATEMTELFGVAPEKLRTVHLGVSPRFRPMDATETAATCQRLGLAHGRYVLTVGTLEPRKNLATLLSAWRQLPPALAKRYPLAIAGQPGWRHGEVNQQIAAMVRAGQVHLLGHVDDADLPALYSASALFVFPSLYEGFGLPPLEAMASGVPVLCANRASLPEVVGAAGVLVEPLDDHGLAEAICSLLEDPAECARLAALGVQRARLFTWAACASKTHQVYRELLPG